MTISLSPSGWRAGLLCASVALLAFTSAAAAWTSAKVQFDANGRLTYPADANGNRIPDFSSAGYKGGGVPLPTVPVVKTISPIAGDNTAHIQAALDQVGAMPVQSNGYRGTLLLNAGVYGVTGTLKLNQSGVVLSGVGDGTDPASNTILRRTGTSTADVITAGGGGDDQFKAEVPNTRSNITTQRVTVGSKSFTVENAALYAVGDNIIVVHPSTQAWIDAVDQGGVTDENVWKAGQNTIRYHRYITGISGNTITIDAPVFNHLDRSLTQSYIHKYDKVAAGILNNIGIEDLLVDIVTAGETSETHCEDAVQFREADDSWIRDCTIRHFWHAGVQFVSSTRCTVERVNAIEPHSVVTGGRRYNFCTYHAQLILFKDSYANNGRHCFIANGTSLDSGIVVLNCTFENTLGYSEGHRHWVTGLLADSCTIVANDSGFAFFNRGNAGTGHGWGAAHSVIWRVSGQNRVEQPPTAQNYAIGCIGSVSTGGSSTTPGYVEGTNVTGLQPASLYLEQLAQRQAAQKVATPSLSPGTGTYSNDLSVTMATATSGATIHYTTDGSDPTPTVGTVYTGPVLVNSVRTLKAIAFKSGMTPSSISAGTYTLQTAPVTFSPGSGTYNSPPSVTLACASSGATIRFTVDGTNPTATTGTVYSGPIAVPSTRTIKAIAVKPGYNPSPISTATYTIVLPPVADPVFNPPAGSYTGTQTVAITSATNGASLRYTTDGSAPTSTTGTLYSGPVTVSVSRTLRAIAYKTDMADSNVVSAAYSIVAQEDGMIVVEAETLARTSSGAVTAPQTDANASGGSWIALNADGVNDFVDYTIPNVPAGTYVVRMKYKAHPNRGILSLRVNGTQVGATLDQYSATTAYPERNFGTTVVNTTGNVIIRLTATGKNSAAGAFTLSADQFILVRQTVTTPVKIAPPAIAAASADDGNIAANTLDGNAATRWSASGNPQWIQYDLGVAKTVSYVKIAWYSGNVRATTFDLQVSSDGTNWTNVLSTVSSGTTSALEQYDFADRTARYVRIVGHGNTANAWNSITETEIWGF